MALKIWWRLDGNGSDSSGNGNTGTITNAASTSSGRVGSAYTFSNNNASVVTSGNVELRGDISLSAWVYPTDLTTPTEDGATIRGVVSNLNHPSTANFSMFIRNSRPYVHVGYTDGTRADDLISDTVLSANTWYHLAMTYTDATRRLSVYLDGALDKAVTLAKQPKFEPYRVIAGQWAYSYVNNYEFIGTIDEVRVYDECLSAREVHELSRARVMHLRLSEPSEVGTTNLFGTTPLTLGVYAYATGPVSTASVPDANLLPRTVSRFTISSAVNTARANIITAVTAGKTYTLSYWIKYNGTNTFSPTFTADASKGSPEASGGNTLAGETKSFTYYANGWYRARYTFTVSATVTGNAQLNHGVSTGTDSAYIGNTFDTYEYQLEEAPNLTPYAQLTRATAFQDSSGYGNSLSSTSPPYLDSVQSKVGQSSAVFSGTSSFVGPSSAGVLSPSTYTKTVWFYPTSGATNNNLISGGTGSQHALWMGGTSTNIRAGHNGNWATVDYDAGSMLNKWNFAAVSFSAATGWRLYYNGQLVDTDASTATFTGDGSVNIGRYDTGNFFTGRISDARVYSSVLSDADILAIYSTRASVDSLGNVHAAEFDQVEEARFSAQYNAVNLIENGSAQLGTTYNFTASDSPTYSTADSYDGDGKSFTRAGNATIISNEYVRVGGFDTYRLVGALRSIGAGGLSSTYLGLACYDADKNLIEHRMSANVTATRTTLAQDLNNDDTTVYLTSTTNWVAGTSGQTAYDKWIAFYDDPRYPDYTYTRKVQRYVTVDGAAKTLTLNSSWDGGFVPAGTAVANAFDGNNYNYLYINSSLPSTWTVATGTITGYSAAGSDTAFRYGTEFVRVLMLLNYSQPYTYGTRFDAIQLYNTTTFQPYRDEQGPSSSGVFRAMEVSEVGPYRGLQAYYPLDGSASDLSGNGYHGTVEVATPTSGARGGAYSFTSGSLITATGALTGLAASQRFTMSAWIYYTAASGRILSSTNNNIGLLLGGTYPNQYLVTIANGTQAGVNGILAPSTWHHVALTYSDGVARAYLNGEFAQSQTFANSSFTTGTNNLLIGNTSNKGSSFVGKIDDVRVYSRALSAEEVRVLYDATRPASTTPVKMTGQDLFTAGELNENEI